MSEEELYVPLKERRRRLEEKRNKRRKLIREEINKEKIDSDDDEIVDKVEQKVPELPPTRSSTSLIDQAYELKKQRGRDGIDEESALKKDQENKLLKEASHVQNVALISAVERAGGKQYHAAMKTTWKPPSSVLNRSQEENDEIRRRWRILVDGENIPPPITWFENMRFPKAIIRGLNDKSIYKPTPIQLQAIPCILAGRDLIGIAFTGSGKTATFTLPLIMLALEEEQKMKIIENEGPFGIILGPSRELMRQTYDVVQHFTKAVYRGGYPELRTMLCIGGEDKRTQLNTIRKRGVHIIVATPGRLNDFLNSRQISLRLCKYICLDEGDRMLDLGFDEEVQNIFNHFTKQRQTLLFSATMPQKFQDFARDVLVQPVVVNVGRAGAANLDVKQEVEYVKQDAKIVHLLNCLQKTPPPVVIFCERKGDVDDIQEYLLLKGVSAVSMHGGKDQIDRNSSIDQFKSSKADVLVATDIAAKGLDFPDIQHVINFDMPSEIENYVHRIGRTGRRGKTGIATTFVNQHVDESALLDLKHLLIEAKQHVPPVLMALDDPTPEISETGSTQGCAFCGGLGHRITDCPKLDSQSRKIGAGRRDYLGGSTGYGGDALG